ncbi:MAG: 23S rRNA (uracil(1939)-C(5))-methyltransferase RlmD [Pseudohongiellaceae bacterium]
MFVAGALAGEQVSARYVRRRSQFDELLTEQVELVAAERVEPPCEYAGICGGCSLQHLATDAQIEFKEQVLLEHLRSATALQPGQFELLPRLTGETRHYRRKARLAVRVVEKKGGALVGFREKYSTFITDMQNCQVLVSDVAALIAPLREMINSLNGRLQIPQIEVAVGELGAVAGSVTDSSRDRGMQVALVFRHLQELDSQDLATLTTFAEQHGFHLYLQPGGNDTVHRVYPLPDESPARLSYSLPEQGIELLFHPMDFTQVNGPINRQIVTRVIELLQLDANDRVLDLFCGLGNFTLPVARRVGSVTGIEGSADMVARGAENARHNRLDNTDFAAADLSKPIADHDWAQRSYDKIILDPPRSGAQEIIADVAGLGARCIAYVSCNPITLARDAALLLEKGYQLKSAGVMDMFPHTNHVESMAIFERST